MDGRLVQCKGKQTSITSFGYLEPRIASMPRFKDFCTGRRIFINIGSSKSQDDIQISMIEMKGKSLIR